MKTGHKMLVVVMCFVIFYVGIIPFGLFCADPDRSCGLVRDVMTHSRMKITVETGINHTGTAWHVERPGIEDFISDNVSFFLIMMATPVCICAAILVLERHKNSPRHDDS